MMIKGVFALTAMCLTMALPVLAQGEESARDDIITADVRNVLERHVLYTVFDYVSYRVENGVVTLMGYATSPHKVESYINSIKKRVVHAKDVKSEIDVLPASAGDDAIRYIVASRIYNDDRLLRYAISNFPKPIHVIVKRARVILEGTVSSEMDKRIVGSVARGVTGVLSVTNNLVVE